MVEFISGLLFGFSALVIPAIVVFNKKARRAHERRDQKFGGRGMTCWVYIKSEPGLFPVGFYTVGFYSPNGEWHTDSDHKNRDDAADRVHYLNGGSTNG